MKKHLLILLMICAASLSALATNRYVATNGDDANDGLSWATAKLTITAAISASSAGDNVMIAAGTYPEAISIKDGVNVLGGYNAATGARDIDAFQTILDGTDLGKFIIVKYDNDCSNPTLIEGLVLQNADHSAEGGGAFIRGNMTMEQCIIRNCTTASGGGGVYATSSNAATPALISHCTIELCNATSSGGGAYLYKNAVMDGCIVRGCCGKYGAIRNHQAGCIVRNCLIYNNTCCVDGWPNSAGIYNETGAKVYNCTVANNYSENGYTGIHSESEVFNCVFWGNRNSDGYADPANFISASSGSGNNYADEGFDSESFATITMSPNNMDPAGPHFNNPTAFIGSPTNAGEIAAMQNADFSLLSTSPLIDKARDDKATATDILGVTRPKGTHADVGAYEFDPSAPLIAVTGVDIYEDTIFIIQGEVGGATVIISPKKATNKRVTWQIDNPAVATVNALGAITALTIDTTMIHVTTLDGGFTDAAVVVVLPIPPTKYPDEVILADSLYKQEDYTVPSYIPFLIAKEAARVDSLNPESDLTTLDQKLADMFTAIGNLVNKEEPYNMVATINGDPKTSMGFCWFTNEGVTQGSVQLLSIPNATAGDFETNPGVITIAATPTTTRPLNYAVSTSGIIKAAKISPKTKFTYVSHKALAENLMPGTTYCWRVGYEGHWSPIAKFKTENENQGEFSFLYMTDSHIMDKEYVDNARWCATAAAATVPDARFCLFPGDFVETGTEQNSEWEWERWFEESIRPVIMKMPIAPTDGNHDDSNNLNYDYHFNTDWGFYSMASTKPQFHGIAYSFVYGDVLFLVYSLQDWWRDKESSETAMKSSYLSNDVRHWFHQQIAAHPDTKYRVTLAHKNIFSGSGHSVDSETPMFREIMLPIMKECEIDLALQGHDHCYEVIGPVNPDTRTVVEGAVTDVDTVPVNTNTNMTGKAGGTFTTDQGTMYFIGATCGRKRYYPYSRAEMDANYDKHKVTNYFDLFTGMFGQPGAPSFTKFTVKEDGIYINSYTASPTGQATLYNTMKVVRNTPHTWTGVEYIDETKLADGTKFIRDDQILIRKDGKTYNILGVEMK
ncbi:MAG: fibronectin type III domain-containing protein [Paludibacteraceae bacterium]|nr:fibronectin type III domain-containing protein [Paludibacteraceae bacterium]